MKTLRQFKMRFWIPSILAGVLFALFALAPQFVLWYDRGPGWNGSFAIANDDEPAYAAYVQSLIDGKPLRNSPYTGTTSLSNPAMKQSLFSIQFLASLPTALFARTFRIDSATAMIFLAGISAFSAAFAVFWLLYLMTDHPLFAFTATVSALALGSVDLESVDFLLSFLKGTDLTRMQSAFMRRSVPAISFPVFILLHCLVWNFVNDKRNRRYLVAPLILSFSFLVYTYLFHWTAAAAWLFSLCVVLFVYNRDFFTGRGPTLFFTAVTCIAVTIPYAFLILDRDRNIDSIQLMLNTRVPELFRVSELIALACIVLLFVARKKGWFPKDGFHFVFLMSMLLLPFIVFNQQIVTGFTLQPFHFSLFAVNYTVLIAFFVIVYYCGKSQLMRPAANKILIILSIGALHFAFAGTAMHIGNFRAVNIVRDEFAGAAKAIADFDASRSGKSNHDRMVVSFDLHNMTNPNNNEFPVFNSRPVLWAPHLIAFSDVTPAEGRSRFLTLLHLSNHDERWVSENVEVNHMLRVALFGWGRNESYLTGKYDPISPSELNQFSKEYRDFRDNFNYRMAKGTELEFVVTYVLAPNDFTEIDRWYQRNRIGQFGDYALFQLRLNEKQDANQ